MPLKTLGGGVGGVECWGKNNTVSLLTIGGHSSVPVTTIQTEVKKKKCIKRALN